MKQLQPYRMMSINMRNFLARDDVSFGILLILLLNIHGYNFLQGAYVFKFLLDY